MTKTGIIMKMFTKSTVTLFLLGILVFVFAFTFRMEFAITSLPVHNINTGLDYATIQEAIDAVETLEGHTIKVDSGTFYERVTIYKSRLTLLGENPNLTIIDGGSIDDVVLITANTVSLIGFTIRNGGRAGIYLDHASNTTLVGNTITSNFYWGIYGDYSANNTIRENNVTSNWCGILFWYSSGSFIYHNNFVSNTIQVYTEMSTNTWDDEYPSGGNYWSSYTGVDKFSGPNQNLPGSDGIGDTPYTMDSENKDRYPLIKPYSQHDVGIINVIPSKTVIQRGENLHINITTLNYGTYTETFNITAYANEIEIQTQTLIQPSRTSITITFVWETTNIDKGTYAIRVYVTPVQGEIDTTDNTFTDGIVLIDTVTTGGGCSSRPSYLLK